MRVPTVRGAWRRLSGAGRAAILAARTPGGIPRDRDLDPISRPEGFPAGLNRWIQRYTGKNRTSYPPSWRHYLSDLRASSPEKIAVLVHVHFPELLPGLLDELNSILVPFDLVITNSSGTSIAPMRTPTNASSTWVLDVPNHGRDILPLVMLVNAGIIDRYELVLKIHTKKSAWRADHELSGSGEEWRASLTRALAGNEHNVSTILDAFADEPDLGIVTADGNVKGAEYWGGDREITSSLLRRLEMELDGRELRFAAGSMYWIRAFVLQGLFALHLSPEDFEEEAGQIDGTTAHGIERLLGVVAEESGYRIVERSELPEPTGNGVLYWSPETRRAPRARVIPFYLPQFHSFAENDLWWGEGFTEWSNVASAQPVFRGHRQPLLPSALGFYDLRHSETRIAQYREAKRAGIEGFMYYYYWFAGRRIMDFPIEDLHSSSDSHPFCIMWANENWSRRWDGSNNDVLVGQDYEHVSADQFIEDVAHLLRDERYLRVDGKPILAIYKLALVPDFAHVIEVWRAFARDAGIGELHILSVDVGEGVGSVAGDLYGLGIDGVLEFPPHNTHWEFVDTGGLSVDPRFRGRIMRYDTTVRSSEVQLRQLDPHRHPGVMVSFDNTARRQWQPDLWYGSNPYTFRRWVDITLRAIADRPASSRILFVNAWNEWAESAVLEPSARFGRSYSLALRDALMR